MALALFIFGIVAILVAALFFWLNLNTPIQTRIPAIAGPIGLGAILVSTGAWLL